MWSAFGGKPMAIVILTPNGHVLQTVTDDFFAKIKLLSYHITFGTE